MKKKCIVLSDTNGSNQKGVLALEEDFAGVRGTLRLYNFSSELNGVSSLGFYVNKKVYKAGLTFKSHMFYEFFLDVKEIPETFSCAVVNFQNAEPTPILYGSSEGSNDSIYSAIISQISENNSFENTKAVLDDYGVDFDDEEKQEIEGEIDKALCDNNCEKCIYKQFFYEHQENNHDEENFKVLSEKSIEKNNVSTSEKSGEFEEKEPSFLNRLKPQIDKLFEKNPIEDNLQKIIPSSKWVKVEYEDDGDFYVFGLLYDENENVKYVCYGVPAVFEDEPPQELSGYPIWLPLNKDNERGFGYWLTYQDAETGEPIKAILD